MNPAVGLLRPGRRQLLLLTALATGLAACSGDPLKPSATPGDAGPAADAGNPGSDAPPDVPPVSLPPPVCRPKTGQAVTLTNRQYNLTVRDLLGDSSAPADAFAPDLLVGDFQKTLASNLSPPELAQYQRAADTLAAAALLRLSTLLPCDPAVTGEEACAGQFIADFGLRAFRRPLTRDDTAALKDAYDVARKTDDFSRGIAAVIAAALKSPHFYRLEEDETTGRPALLSPYEMAARLSYFLYRSMPDDALLAAAAAGQLATKQQVAAQAQRMLADPKAQEGVKDFFGQLLGLNQLDVLAATPGLTPDVVALYHDMKTETVTFAASVFFGDSLLATLLRSNQTSINQRLAAVYGVPGIVGDAFQAVTLDPAVRVGLLTQASLLSIGSQPPDTELTRRGVFVLEKLLCLPFPPPPNGIPLTVTKQAGETKRTALAASLEPQCKPCHFLSDPIGGSFEGFDFLGRARTVDENGLAVDTTGSLAEISSEISWQTDGAFKDPVQLAAKLTASDVVPACLARHWLQFALPRWTDFDASNDPAFCELQGIQQRWVKPQNLKDLIIQIVSSDSFRLATDCIPVRCSSSAE